MLHIWSKLWTEKRKEKWWQKREGGVWCCPWKAGATIGIHNIYYIKIAYLMLSLTMRWFISETCENSPVTQTPSEPLTWGWETHESIDMGAWRMLHTSPQPCCLLPLSSPNSSTPFPASNMLSSATLELFLVFWKFLLTAARRRHIFCFLLFTWAT